MLELVSISRALARTFCHTLPFLVLNLTRCNPYVMFYSPWSVPPPHARAYNIRESVGQMKRGHSIACKIYRVIRLNATGVSGHRIHRTMYVHFHTARLRRVDNLRQNCVAKKRECMCLITLDFVYNRVCKVNCGTTWAYTINKITWTTVSRYVAHKWEANLHRQASLLLFFYHAHNYSQFYINTNISY